MVTGTIATAVKRRFGVEPFVLGPGADTGIAVRYDNPHEVGADRVANAVGGFARYGGPLIVVDFGTATTFDAIAADGAYLGGAIAPGLRISIEALSQRAARLPRIDLVRPVRAIGTNTAASMQSGIIFGYAGLVEALVARICPRDRRLPARRRHRRPRGTDRARDRGGAAGRPAPHARGAATVMGARAARDASTGAGGPAGRRRRRIARPCSRQSCGLRIGQRCARREERPDLACIMSRDERHRVREARSPGMRHHDTAFGTSVLPGVDGPGLRTSTAFETTDCRMIRTSPPRPATRRVSERRPPAWPAFAAPTARRSPAATAAGSASVRERARPTTRHPARPGGAPAGSAARPPPHRPIVVPPEEPRGGPGRRPGFWRPARTSRTASAGLLANTDVQGRCVKRQVAAGNTRPDARRRGAAVVQPAQAEEFPGFEGNAPRPAPRIRGDQFDLAVDQIDRREKSSRRRR